MPTRPSEIDTIIKSYTKSKVPKFFIYAKNKLPSQVEPANQSVMNRIAEKFPPSKLKFCKTIGKFDYRMLMNFDCDFSISSDNPVVKSYDYWNKHQKLFTIEPEKHQKQEDLYLFQQIRERIIQDTQKDLHYIVNTLVAFLYTVRKTSSKKTLWACFGDVILENLKTNLKDSGKICAVCGKRFAFNNYAPRSVCCSKDCSEELNRRKAKQRKKFDYLL